MRNVAYLAIIEILQNNAKEKEVDVNMIKDIYDMEENTLSSQIAVDEDNLKQKIIKGMEQTEKIKQNEKDNGIEK